MLISNYIMINKKLVVYFVLLFTISIFLISCTTNVKYNPNNNNSPKDLETSNSDNGPTTADLKNVEICSLVSLPQVNENCVVPGLKLIKDPNDNLNCAYVGQYDIPYLTVKVDLPETDPRLFAKLLAQQTNTQINNIADVGSYAFSITLFGASNQVHVYKGNKKLILSSNSLDPGCNLEELAKLAKIAVQKL